jgi:hypothetical protein
VACPSSARKRLIAPVSSRVNGVAGGTSGPMIQADW